MVLYTSLRQLARIQRVLRTLASSVVELGVQSWGEVGRLT
jgi:hypothetical protein